MNDEQINRAIAEACGFVRLHEFQVDKDGAKFAFWEYPPSWTGVKKQPWCLDFCSDLNAMHEAEKTLNCWEDYVSYQSWLGYCGQDIIGELQQCITATARQRAEAFLRTIGKWEEATCHRSA